MLFVSLCVVSKECDGFKHSVSKFDMFFGNLSCLRNSNSRLAVMRSEIRNDLDLVFSTSYSASLLTYHSQS